MNKVKLGEAIKQWIAEKYFGKRILGHSGQNFSVDHIEITDSYDGMEIVLRSNNNKAAEERYIKWLSGQRDAWKLPVPPELDADNKRFGIEKWYMCGTSSELPEIVD